MGDMVNDDDSRTDAWKAGGWGAMLRAPIYARTPEQAIHILFALQGMRRMSW